MITLILFCLIALVFLVMAILRNIARVGNAITERDHDRILYAFCDVRDSFALRAINKEISEDSEVFKFFYSTLAKLVHDHPHHGKCFVDLIREIYKKKTRNNKTPEQTLLAKELEQADEETKRLAMVFINAYTQALFSALPFVLADRMACKFIESKNQLILKVLANNPLSTTQNRNAANFGLALARAACM